MEKLKKKVSIIVPLYNEAKNIELLYNSVLRVIQQQSEYIYEFVLVNDGSSDDTWNIIQNLPQSCASVYAINFSKNFGHQIALTAGYHSATGDAIITMDGDLQHPPEAITAMLQAWRSGFAIVYVKNRARNVTFLKKIAALGYYHFLERLSEVKIPRNIADFRLIDRKVLTVINQSNEKTRYLRGLVAWTGFNHTIISCDFAKRHFGIPGYTWNKMFKLALDGILSFSSAFPFYHLKITGYIILLLELAISIYAINFLLYQNYSLGNCILFISAFILTIAQIAFSTMGEIVKKYYDSSKKRPLYVIADSINC